MSASPRESDAGQAAPCVAPTWPDVVTDDWGTYWVRLDLEHRTQEFVGMWDGETYVAHRLGRVLMVRDAAGYSDGSLLEADGDADDGAIYVRFEASEDGE